MSEINKVREKILELTEQLVVSYRILFDHHREYWISRQLAPSSARNPSKETAKSSEFRAKGDQDLESIMVESALHAEGGDRDSECKMLESALKAYHESVAHAPAGEDLCLAMAQRSKVQLERKDYEACILDINRTLSIVDACPLDVKNELELRKDDCLDRIRKLNEEKNTYFRGITGSVQISPTANVPGGAFSNLIRHKFSDLKMTGHETELPNSNRLGHIISPDTFQNAFIPNASTKIRMENNFQFGRHIIANEKIVTSEILFFEDPFASVLFQNFSRSHCSHCFARTNALIPCGKCVKAMYCGERCRDQAHKSYHRFECKVIDFLQTIVELDNYDLLTLRVTLIGLQKLGGSSSLNGVSYPPDFLSKKRPFVGEKLNNDYDQACNLERCVGSLIPEYHKTILHKCSYLLYGLSFASFFEDSEPTFTSNLEGFDGAATNLQKLVGLHLINNYYVILSNPYQVDGVVLKPPPPDNKDHDILGAALYCFTSLLNHSCDPNCSYYFVKDRIIMYANRPIAAGEQIFTSYGPLYTVEKLQERRRNLSQYGFRCECLPCQMNWPTMAHLKEPIPLPYVDSAAMLRLRERVKLMLSQMEWNVGNYNAINDMLDFHRQFATLVYSYYTAPSLWNRASFFEIERIMELHGNLHQHHGADEHNFTKAVEEIVEYTLFNNLREWFPLPET